MLVFTPLGCVGITPFEGVTIFTLKVLLATPLEELLVFTPLEELLFTLLEVLLVFKPGGTISIYTLEVCSHSGVSIYILGGMFTPLVIV